MANTTNFGWETPDDTDLVKDGAAAMRTLGDAIDASFIDLKGGTTGQVLAKASNTDLDFTWSSVDPLTILDAKGDLISATAADTPARLAVGSNGQILTVDSSTSTGLKWAAAPTSALAIAEIASGSMPSASSLSLSSLSSYDTIIVRISGVTFATDPASILVRINSNTGNNYELVGGYNQTTYSVGFGATSSAATSLYAGFGAASQLRTDSDNNRWYVFTNCKSTGFTNVVIQEDYTSSGGDTPNANSIGMYKVAEAVSSIQFVTSTGFNYTAGSYVIWGG